MENQARAIASIDFGSGSFSAAIHACSPAFSDLSPCVQSAGRRGEYEGQFSGKLTLPMPAVQLIGGQGRYDFTATRQPCEIILVLTGDSEVQSFAFGPGAPVYPGFTYTDGVVTSSPYDQSVPIPTPYILSTIATELQTEHTGIGLNGSWIFVMATMMSLIAVGCFATVRRKGR